MVAPTDLNFFDLLKYPRTPHLIGSRLQTGDTTDDQIALSDIIGQQVWEEKIDGSNVGISFSENADLRLQSRGHFLTGGWREKQYTLFKQWANYHVEWLFDVLNWRYVMYGEWCYAKHTVFYDQLPHYFLEFDIYDRQENVFLNTARRRRLLRQDRDSYQPVFSVPVVHFGNLTTEAAMRLLVRHSLYKSTDWLTILRQIAAQLKMAFAVIEQQTDQSSLSEGLYLKVEDDAKVIGRYKFVRADFLQTIADSQSHWNTRPILPNQLAPSVNLFG